MKVFLGGTVNGSDWRNKLIPRLDIDYFDPVVKEWNDEAYERELYERQHCDFCLYVITPKMTGYYALAEVTDDSYKRPDRTLYCYLEHDGHEKFSDEEIEALKKLGNQVLENGGKWLQNLEEISDFLNSGLALNITRTDKEQEFDDVFISYGRRHSKAFATKLHDTLTDEHYSVWFDQNDIPLGVDFQEQINEGISRAHNFVFIISPHSIRSEYCLKEIELAVKLNKRIIPLMHIEPVDELDKIHPAIAKINWIYIREEADENKELYEWKQIDDFSVSYQGLIQSIGNHASYVEMHTSLLIKAIQWENNQRAGQYLLVGKERQEAEKWLTKKFIKGQPPCIPTDLHCEFICESKKNGENLMTEVFIAYAVENQAFRNSINKQLLRQGITTWVHTKDIKTGQNFEQAIREGVAQADNFILFLSKASLESDYCRKELDIALGYNKRIIPVLTEPLQDIEIPEKIKLLQYIDFLNEAPKFKEDDFEESETFFLKATKLVSETQKDRSYFQKHKRYLAQALKWEEQQRNESLLLRGYNLQDAEAWLEIGKTREAHRPIHLHETFIATSGTKRFQLTNEVFISYSRADSDFARKLNDSLQIQGKTTWFDQESIASGVDFQEEIYRGIESSDNFLFVISPESIKSPYCADEVEYAARLNKRFITILLRKSPYLHPTLAAVQWLDFEKREFDESFNDLISLLDTDREYVQQHTKWSQRALTWDEQGQNTGLFLSGLELENAFKWLNKAKVEEKKPKPTSLLISFINQSIKQDKKDKKRKILLTAMVVVMAGLFLIAGAMALFALKEKREADEQRILANIKRIEADSLKANAQADKLLADSLKNIAIAEKHIADSLKNIAFNEKQIADSLRLVTVKRNNALQSALKAAEESRKAAFAAEIRANEQAKRAKDEAERANNLADLAEQRLAEAEVARQKAEEALAQYEIQKTKAEEAQIAFQEQKATVDKMTMLSAASQLALSSKNEFNNGNISRAKVLALHAYFLNRQYTSTNRKISLNNEIDRLGISDTMMLTSERFNEKTGNIPAIFEALSDVYFYDKKDLKIGSKSPISTFASTNEEAKSRGFVLDPIQIVAAGDEDGQLFIYRINNEEILETLSTFSFKTRINFLKFLDNSNELLIGTDGGIFHIVNNYTDGKRNTFQLTGNTKEPVVGIEEIRIDQKPYYITATNNRVAIWEIIEGKSGKFLDEVYNIKTETAHSIAVTNYSKEKIYVAVGTDDITEIYEINTSKRGTPQLVPKVSMGINYKTRQFTYTSNAVTALTFSKDGKKLVTAHANGNIELWQMSDFSQVGSYFGHTSDIHSILFSNKENRLISGGEDQTIRIWDEQNSENSLLLKNESAVYQIEYINSTNKIVSLRNEQFLRFWPSESAQLVKSLCSNITKDELLPLTTVYQYAGIEFIYLKDNCVYQE